MAVVDWSVEVDVGASVIVWRVVLVNVVEVVDTAVVVLATLVRLENASILNLHMYSKLCKI